MARITLGRVLSAALDSVAAYLRTSAKGATPAGEPTSTDAGSARTLLDVILRGESGDPALPNHDRDIANEQVTPLGAAGVFQGAWRRVDAVPRTEWLYASLTSFTAEKRWSGNGVDDLDRTLTDAVLNGTTTVTSAAGTFTKYDRGSVVTGTGIPANTVIASVSSATTVELSQAATTSASGVSLVLNSPFDPSVLPQQVVNGYNVVYDVGEGRILAPYHTLRITNGATPQTLFPGFISIAWLIKTPYTGAFGLLTAPLTNLSRALLTRAALAVLLPSGQFGNVTGTDTFALRVGIENSPANAAGELRVTGIQDTIRHYFTASEAPAAIARLINASVGGTCTADPVEGQAVFSTGATPGNTAVFFSEKHARYQGGHPIQGDQTFTLESLPTGNAKVEFGYSDQARANGLGYGVDATGVYVWRKKNGVYESKVYQLGTPAGPGNVPPATPPWNRDKCDASANSRFVKAYAPQAFTALANNLYFTHFEWFGGAPINYALKAPNDLLIPTHVEEYPNQNVGSSLPDPNLHLFVAVQNDTTAGGDLRVRSGCWRGGSHTSQSEIVGLDPNNDYANIRAQGSHAGNSFSGSLDAGGIYRGTWFPWQQHYVKLLSDLKSDQKCQLFVDLSEVVDPVNGDDSSVTDSLGPLDYDPAVTPLLRRHTVVQSIWVRHRIVNGPAAANIVLDGGFVIADPGTGLTPFATVPTSADLAGMVRAIPGIPTDNATPPTAYKEWPVATDGVMAPIIRVDAIDEDIKIGALRNFENGQLLVGPTRVQVPPPPFSRVKGISLTNLDADTDVFWGDVTCTATSFSDVVLARGGKDLELDGYLPIYLIAAPTGAVTAQSSRYGAATLNNAGVVNPNNLLTDDATRATFDDQGDSVQVNGFTAAGAQPDVASIKLKVKARKATSPTTETVTFVDVVTGTAGNVGSVSSGSVTANAAHFYLVAISRRSTTAEVTQVTGLGVTWQAVGDITGGESHVSLYRSTTAPTTGGTVTASFTEPATNSVIGVYRFSNVDLTTPIQNAETLSDMATSASYSDTIVGTVNGLAAVFVSMGRRLHTPGSGFTERNETRTGTNVSDASLAGNTLALAGGAQAYSGAFDGAVGWSLVAVTLTPAPATTPVLTLSYAVGAEPPGLTQLTAALTATSDTSYEANLSGDRVWTASDIAATVITVSASTLGAADAEVNAVWLDVTEIEADVTARVTYSWLGEP